MAKIENCTQSKTKITCLFQNHFRASENTKFCEQSDIDWRETLRHKKRENATLTEGEVQRSMVMGCLNSILNLRTVAVAIT